MHTSSYASVPTPAPVAPVWQGASAEIQDLCQTWIGWRAGPALPQRADIDYADLAGSFSDALLVEIIPASEASASHRYMPIAALGEGGAADPAGWLDPALFQHIPVSCCHLVAATREPRLERVAMLSSDGLLLDYEVVFLPLASAGGIVEAILVLAIDLSPAN